MHVAVKGLVCFSTVIEAALRDLVSRSARKFSRNTQALDFPVRYGFDPAHNLRGHLGGGRNVFLGVLFQVRFQPIYLLRETSSGIRIPWIRVSVCAFGETHVLHYALSERPALRYPISAWVFAERIFGKKL